MRDEETVAALIERIVARARIPGRARRDELRRELWTHFEEANRSPDGAREAVRRFGADAPVGAALRDVYRWDYALWYLAKIGASIVASIAAALLIQVVVNLRVELRAEAWRLAPGFSRAAGMSVAVVLGLITVWEAARPPFRRARAAVAVGAYAAVCVAVRVLFLTGAGGLITATMLVGIGHLCSRLDRWPPRLLALVGAFAAAFYVNHVRLSVAFGPGRALIAGAILGAVWSSTVVILRRVDRAFAGVFEPAQRQEI
jgi:hypothetical protein